MSCAAEKEAPVMLKALAILPATNVKNLQLNKK